MKSTILVRELNDTGVYVSMLDTDKAFITKNNHNGLFLVVVEPIENVIEYMENPDDDGFYVFGEGYILAGNMNEINKKLEDFLSDDFNGYELVENKDLLKDFSQEME